ncbi:siroheme synthase CysG [Marinagarivorans algicola]|uniref:siroheme synthase CysG n=1 Tax=Marinagarivorans algicola TaxID=1513270 RepID=UPI0037366E32
MRYFPFFHDLQGKTCLLVGGGTIALRKARLLAKAGARITVVAPNIGAELAKLIAATGGQCVYQPYTQAHLNDAVLVISATDIDSVNTQVAEDCNARKLPVNVVDDPSKCTIITPAIVDRSPLIIGITSGGEAPVLARMVRSRLEALLPSTYGLLGQLASRFRDAVKARFSDGEQRRRFWEHTLQGPVAEQVFAKNLDQAEQLMRQALDRADDAIDHMQGEVYLVGAGPGDPDLLTFKALRLMQQAEVVLYDRLVSPPILELVRRDAERIYVGKKRDNHAVPQQDINQLLVDLAKQGKRVLRLKGGDPFIFGRGGEEIELLAENNVSFQVVPGITAASGCAAYSGIPLTHRDHAQSVRFVTGHLKEGSCDLPFTEMASANQTLVFYMGLVALPDICQRLIAAGKDPKTPCALIERGTTPDHQVHTGDLTTLPLLIKNTPVKAPTLLIIGSVVSLQSQLNWYKGSR